MENYENEKNWTKEEVFTLMDDKKRIESEMGDWTEVLNCQGGVGMHEPLIDAEGLFVFTKVLLILRATRKGLILTVLRINPRIIYFLI